MATETADLSVTLGAVTSTATGVEKTAATNVQLASTAVLTAPNKASRPYGLARGERLPLGLNPPGSSVFEGLGLRR